MRILQYLPDLNGNTTTFIRKQIELLALKHQVYVLTNCVVNSEYRLSNVNYIHIPLAFLSPNKVLRKIYWWLYKYGLWLSFKQQPFSNKLKELLNEIKPDIIHCQFGDNGLVLLENLSLQHSTIPFFIQFRGYDATQMPISFPLYWGKLNKVLQKKNVYSIAVANYLYDHMDGLGFKPNKRRVLYSCTDISKFKRNKRESKHRTFVQISSFREKKGHKYTLLAFAAFLGMVSDHYEYELVLAGEGELLEESKQLATELNIHENVKFIGKVTHDEGKQLLEDADFFVHHSITSQSGDKEGIPNAIMEAMAMELPVIATYHSGIPELVENGVNGFLVKEMDVEDYSQKMAEIVSWDYQPRNRKKVEELFEQQIHFNTLVKYYKEAL